ncbi:hypothetical protein [Dactylosporangium darangshiense]|uniref:DUF2958 domain-containing protein n=1 Tax=Dactylosporangium darangshiense TaxID=579108 RepID=A0ABP8DMR0_9ACTN
MLVHYRLGACDWWICKYDPQTGEAYGYTCVGDPFNAEWGYIPLTELEQMQAGPEGLLIVWRDLSWEPVPFSQVRHACTG